MTARGATITETQDARATLANKRPKEAIVVRCLNPTANKPLHVGHLRNASIGMAVAAALEATGTPARTHCLLEDVGRFMAEAVAAYRASGGSVPEGEKADQYIGRCYRDYRTGRLKLPKPSGLVRHGDIADELLERQKLGDREATGFWQNVVELARAGQGATLRRLGIAFEHSDPESGENPYLPEFIRQGRKLGLFAGKDNGRVVARVSTGQTIELLDRFGHAKEHLYLLSFLYRSLTAPGRAGLHIAVAGGQEWERTLLGFVSILEGLGVRSARERYEPVSTGLVTLDGTKVASRTGHGHLVDDVLDELANSKVAVAIAQSSAGVTTAEHAAAVAVRLFFLAVPRTSDFEFRPNLLTGNPEHRVWDITRAWSGTRDRPLHASDGLLMNEARAALAEAATYRSFEHVIEFLNEMAREKEISAEFEDRLSALRLLMSGLGIGKFKAVADRAPFGDSLLLPSRVSRL